MSLMASDLIRYLPKAFRGMLRRPLSPSLCGRLAKRYTARTLLILRIRLVRGRGDCRRLRIRWCAFSRRLGGIDLPTPTVYAAIEGPSGEQGFDL